MKPLSWSAMNRVEHPPLMVTRLSQALTLSKRYRDCINLSKHLTAKAIQEGYLSASNAERESIGLATLSARRLRQANMAADNRLPYKEMTPHNNNNKEGKVPKGKDVVSLVPLNLTSNALAKLPQRKEKRLVTLDILDCTFGAGHHTRELLEEGNPFVRVVALDCDLDVYQEAKRIEEEFGSARFRFFGNCMSNAYSMFGDKAFDMIVIDPGPNAMQLFDPRRGFSLSGAIQSSSSSFGSSPIDEIGASGNHRLDMRYTDTFGTSALTYLNAEDYIAITTAITEIGLLHFREALRLTKAIKANRPLGGSYDVFGILDNVGGPIEDDGWVASEPIQKLSPAMRYLISLRCVINREKEELGSMLRHCLNMLRNDGQLVVFTRLKWEEELLQKYIGESAEALPVFKEKVTYSDIEEYGFSPSTTLHTYRRVPGNAYSVKNDCRGITEEELSASAFTRMVGLDATSSKQYPAKNFTFPHFDDEEERRIKKENANGPNLEETGEKKKKWWRKYH
eukprot:Tbor_TRINITY_DN4078_c0_g1::TRINITY_DN4078_c0_g1_i1::g.11716::m.11716/K03438/mraW, rsmH; 16S rRNA (cytosine1402-N4)-methyltransferase